MIKIKTIFPEILFFSLTIFFFNPAFLYIHNYSELPYSFLNLCLYLIPLTVLVFMLLTGIILLIPQKFFIFNRIRIFIFMLGFLCWVQPHISGDRYGLLDGREIEWNQFLLTGILETAGWVIILISAIILYRKMEKFSKLLSFLFMLIQLASLGWESTQLPPKYSFQKYKIDDKDKWVFSNKKNAILILLDNFQSDIFQEIISEDSTLLTSLDGFDYFRNATSSFPRTAVSVCNILTGKVYDNTIPVQEFIKNAFFSETSLLKILKENQYKVQIFPWEGTESTVCIEPDIISNTLERKYISLKQISTIFDLSLFMNSPFFIKKIIYNEQKWLFKNWFSEWDEEWWKGGNKPVIKKRKIIFGNAETYSKSQLSSFINDFYDKGSVVNHEGYVFKYYHLEGIHEPYNINENFELNNHSINRENLKMKGKAALKILKLFMDKLKALNVYNNSLIFIVGDHGDGYEKTGFNNSFLKNHFDSAMLIEKKEMIIKTGVPVFLIKKINSSGILKINDIPVSLNDVSTTLLQELDLKDKKVSIYSRIQEKTPDRKFYFYDINNHEKYFLLPLKEYAIKGHSWLGNSWVATGKILSPAYKFLKNMKDFYELNRIINIDETGEYLTFVKKGLSPPKTHEIVGAVNGSEVKWVLPIIKKESDLILKTNLSPYSNSPQYINQIVNVTVNDCNLKHWLVNKDSSYFKIIPSSCIGNELEVTFHLADSFVSKGDKNIRSIIIKYITLFKYYQPGEIIEFRTRGNYHKYAINGFSSPEEMHVWTVGNTAHLVIPVNRNNSKQYAFKAHIAPYLAGGKISAQNVNIFINDEFSKPLKIDKESWIYFTFDNPLQSNGFMKISFLLPDANSPKVMENAEDDRMLALAFFDLVIVEIK